MKKSVEGVDFSIAHYERYLSDEANIGIRRCGLHGGGDLIEAAAQVKQGKTRLAKTKQLMKGLVAANCGALGDGLKTTPADDKGWDELAINAAFLNEASYLLMDDGRCPDDAWANAATQLREGSATVLAKLDAHDATGAQEAFKVMTQACGACHKVHKK